MLENSRDGSGNKRSRSIDDHFTALRIAGIYFLFGVLWIWFSDWVLLRAGFSAEQGAIVSSGKGTLFVLLSALLIFWLIRSRLSQLSHSHELLRAVTDGTADAIYVKDRDGRYLYVNRAAAQMVGVDPATVLGKDDSALFDVRDSRSIIERDRQIMDEDRSIQIEEDVSVAGSARTFLSTKSPYRNDDGNVIGIVGISCDITDRLQMQMKIRASEQRYQELADAIPQIIFIAGPDGGMTHVNAKTTEYTGAVIEEFLGQSWERFIHPDDLAALVELWRRVIHTGQPLDAEFRFRRADGTYRWHIGRQVPARDSSGQIKCWYGSCTDIEDLRQAQDRLRNEQILLRTLIDSLPDLIFTKDCDGRFQLSNRSHVEFTGSQSEDEIRGKTVFDLYPSELAAAYREDDLRVLNHGETIFDREEVARDAAGRNTWRHVIKAPLRDSAGNITGLVGMSRDIQARKEREQALKDRERLLSIVTDAARAGLVVVGDSYKVLFANEAYAEIMGAPTQEVVGRKVPDLIPEIWAQIQPRLDQALRGERVSFEIKRPSRCVANQEIWLRAIYEPRLTSDGRRTVVAVVVDITERKEAEEQLRAERDRFKIIMETVPVVICSYRLSSDGTNSFPYSSPRIEEIFGISPESLARDASPIFSLIHPKDVERFEESIAESARTMTNCQTQFRVNSPVRGEIWIEGHSTPVLGADGSIVWHGYIADVTERMRTEDALRQSERQLRDAQQIARLGHWGWEPSTGRVWWSQGIFEIFGIENSAVKPSFDAFLTIVHPDDRLRAIERVEAVLSGANGFADDLRVIRSDGQLIWIHSQGRAIRDNSGRLVRVEGTDQDVSSRKRAEQALISSEARLRLFLDYVPAPIAMLDRELRYLHYSRRWLSDYQLGDREITGLTHYEVFPNLPERWKQVHRRCLAGAVERCEEDAFDRVDGARMWILWEIRPWFQADGEIGGIIIFSEDITARKRAEKIIQESEERYRRLVEILPSALFINVDGKIAFCNPAFLDLVGAPSSDGVIGRSPFEIVHPDYHQLVRSRIATMQNSGQAAPGIQLKITRVDGRVVPVYSVATPVIDSGPPAFLIVLSDLTERERSMQLLRTVLGSVNDAILTIDVNGKVKSANPSTERLFGYAESELVGKNVNVLMPAPYHEEHDTYISNYLRTGEAKVIGIGREVDGRRKDGTTFPLELTVTEFQIDGERNFTGVVRDITSRKRLEAQFQQSQKMEAVGRLAGGVAHDFNNLLTIINGYADLMLAEMPATDRRYEAVTAILDAGERAARLTHQLLAFSRKAIVEPKMLDLNELVEHSSRMVRRLVGEDVILSVIRDPELARIRADEGQLEQVILNLVVNARDAMPTGGRLTIETKDVVLGDQDMSAYPDQRPGRYAQLIVTDTGCGMTQQVQSKIFEPFFTTKGVGKGSGLGLAVVHGVVKQCGGSISVKSAVGTGTTITILLPIAPGSVEATSTDLQRSAMRGTETLLVVEDEDAVRTFARIALQTHGYKVLEAASGKSALQLADDYAQNINLLITDVVMPEMGGRELVEEIRIKRPGLKVLYMSGYTDDAVVRHGVSDAADAFIQKPFSPSAIARKVRSVLDGTP